MNNRRAPFLASLCCLSLTLTGCSDEEAPAVADTAATTSAAAAPALSPATPPASNNGGAEHGGDSGHGDSGNGPAAPGMSGGGEHDDDEDEHGGGGMGMPGSPSMGAPAGMGAAAGNGLPGAPNSNSVGGGEHGAASGGASMGMPGMGAPAGMNGASGSSAGFGNGNANRGSMGAVASGRPSNPRDWTREDILAGVREKDPMALQAIEAKARVSNGDPQFVALAQDILGNSSGGNGMTGLGGPGMAPPPGFPSLPFGGLGSRATISEPTMPKPAAGSKPPGGATLEHAEEMIRDSTLVPVDSLDAMLGEALLGYQSFGGGGPGVMGQAGGQMTIGPSSGQPQGSATGFANQGNVSRGQPSQGAPSLGAPGAGGGFGNSAGSSGFGSPSPSPRPPAGPRGLTPETLVRTLVAGLVVNDTAEGWQLINEIANGEVNTELPEAKNLQIVLEEILPSKSVNPEFITNLVSQAVTNAVENDDPEAQKLVTRLSQSVVSQYYQFGSNSTGPGSAPSFAGGNRNGSPGMGAPGMGAPGMGAPGMGAPGMGAPSLGTPGAGAPSLGSPGAGSPSLGTPGAGAPSLGAPSMGAPGGGEDDDDEHFGSGGGEHVGGGMSSGGFAPSGLGQFGGQASGGLPSFGGSPASGPLSPIEISEIALPAVAAALWSPSVAAAVAEQVQQGGNLTSAGTMIALAANLPKDGVRRQLYELMSQDFKTGAAPLSGSGFVNSSVDPGTLNVLKALPRVRQPRETPAANSEAALKMTWVALTKQYVLRLRDRVRNAESGGGFTASGPPKLRLHRGATPQVSLEIAIPEESLEALGQSKPSDTKVYYTRSTVAPRNDQERKSILEHYEKQAKGYVRPYESEGMMWIDGLRKNANGTLQTMDVIITLSGRQQSNQFGGGQPGGFGESGGPGQAANGSSFTLETLVVVTKDPSLELGDELTSK